MHILKNLKPKCSDLLICMSLLVWCEICIYLDKKNLSFDIHRQIEVIET